jgi:DNA repair protein RecO (recombination protein O)
MSAIVRTEALVLRSMKYRETSKIVTFYSREFGKVSGMVKGACRPKNKYGSSLEPMTFVSLVIYRRDGRELGTVAECDALKHFPRIAENLEAMAVGLGMMELLTMVAHEEENKLLFQLVVGALDALNDATKNPRNVFYYFELQLARVLGFEALFERCVSCSKPLSSNEQPGERFEYHLDRGGPLCRSCNTPSGHKVHLSPKAFRIIGRIAGSRSTHGICNIEIDDGSRTEIESFLWSYLSYHLSGLRPLKSTKVFSRILTRS